MAQKFTSVAFLPPFIDTYREMPCLWKVKSKAYSNRLLCDEAMKKLIELCKTVCVNANENYVKNKIANLRTVFQKELNKMENSKKSGAGTDDVYVPWLWYFQNLMFLTDSDMPRESQCTLLPGPSDEPSCSPLSEFEVLETQLQESEATPEKSTHNPCL
ncbi:unnamed protein product [Staurois parvus]|uniref:MADF domain-containing protein n=1 Tax=Staurois parvus TaxID=386267 RepID=A0ABN9FLT3_9NEOB|nr:unnamed protein product [Staurois parvus]